MIQISSVNAQKMSPEDLSEITDLINDFNTIKPSESSERRDFRRNIIFKKVQNIQKRYNQKPLESTKTNAWKMFVDDCKPTSEDANEIVVFLSKEDCDSARKKKNLYESARDAIPEPVGKLGDALSVMIHDRMKKNVMLEKNKEQLTDSINRGDHASSEMLQKQVKRLQDAALELDSNIKAMTERRDTEFAFLNKYILEPLSHSEEDTINFYTLLKETEENKNKWTLGMVAQSFVNQFKIPIPGYDLGGVSGLSSNFVKEVLLKSKLRPHITDEILAEIMSSLGSEQAVPDEDMVESDTTKRHIIHSALENLKENLNNSDPREIPREKLNKLMTDISTTEVEMETPGTRVETVDLSTKVWSDATDQITDGTISSKKYTIMGLLAAAATWGASHGMAPLTSSAVSVPITTGMSVVSLVSKMGHVVPMTQILSDTKLMVGSRALAVVQDTIAAMASVPMTANSVPAAFTATTGISAAVFPSVMAVIATGAVLFAISRLAGRTVGDRYIAFTKNKDNVNVGTLLTIDPMTETVTQQSIPKELTEEAKTASDYLSQMESKKKGEVLDISRPSAKMIRRLSESSPTAPTVTKNVRTKIVRDGENMLLLSVDSGIRPVSVEPVSVDSEIRPFSGEPVSVDSEIRPVSVEPVSVDSGIRPVSVEPVSVDSGIRPVSVEPVSVDSGIRLVSVEPVSVDSGIRPVSVEPVSVETDSVNVSKTPLTKRTLKTGVIISRTGQKIEIIPMK
jgi:hypothetical protein